MTYLIYKDPVIKVQIYSNDKPAKFKDPMRKRQIAKLRGNMQAYHTKNEINHMSKKLKKRFFN